MYSALRPTANANSSISRKTRIPVLLPATTAKPLTADMRPFPWWQPSPEPRIQQPYSHDDTSFLHRRRYSVRPAHLTGGGHWYQQPYLSFATAKDPPNFFKKSYLLWLFWIFLLIITASTKRRDFCRTIFRWYLDKWLTMDTVSLFYIFFLYILYFLFFVIYVIKIKI